MKQQCHIFFIYGSWVIYLAGLLFLFAREDYIRGTSWLVLVPLVLWAYVRFFPSISQYMGYGSVQDQPAKETGASSVNVTLYTGLGCPFCPIVKARLQALKKQMGFQLKDVDVTLKPNVLISKGIRALPVVEVGTAVLVGNATSDQLAKLILEHGTP